MPATSPVQLSLPEGETLRDEAMIILARHARLIDGLRAVAKMICESKAGGECSASEVRATVRLPQGVSHNVMGSVFRHAMFEFVRWEKSRQPQRRANREGVWRLRNGTTPCP